jgi:hypothetical protein
MPTKKKDGSKLPERFKEITLAGNPSALARRNAPSAEAPEKPFDPEGDSDQAILLRKSGFRNAGRMTRQRRGNQNEDDNDDGLNFGDSGIGLIGTADKLAGALISLATGGLFSRGDAAEGHSGMSAQFGQKVSQRSTLQPPHEDDEFIYDTMQVSRPVFEKLLKESEMVAKKLEELEAIKDPVLRETKLKEIERLAIDFEMRLHPITEVYVHDYNRVLREEKSCGTQHNHKHDAQELHVCFFRAKAAHDDLKGVKSKVADQFDNTPEEVQVSGDQFKGAAPAPTPSGP